MDLLTLSRDVLAAARARDVWLVSAESCTGGGVVAALTEVAGSSDVVAGGMVVYANAMKMQLLDVSTASLARYGAVSEEVACEMARGAVMRTQLAMRDGRGVASVAITGIAGPAGGNDVKPVGLVHIAAYDGARDVLVHRRCQFSGDRTAVRHQAVIAALEMLLQVL